MKWKGVEGLFMELTKIMGYLIALKHYISSCRLRQKQFILSNPLIFYGSGEYDKHCTSDISFLFLRTYDVSSGRDQNIKRCPTRIG